MSCASLLWVIAGTVGSFLYLDTFYHHFLLVHLEVYTVFVSFLFLWVMNEAVLVPFSHCV